jgi:hypothetical protein
VRGRIYTSHVYPSSLAVVCRPFRLCDLCMTCPVSSVPAALHSFRHTSHIRFVKKEKGAGHSNPHTSSTTSRDPSHLFAAPHSMVSMAPVLRPRALDGTTQPNIDALGIGYLVIAIAYTLLLTAELYLLYRRREAFCVRIRNIRVVFAAVLMLHIYLVLVLLVYPWNGLFPCSAEFWIMSVFLPSGMAFFQSKSLSSSRTCFR